jgi:hypothetical protein
MPSELRVLQAQERVIGPLACYIVRGRPLRKIRYEEGLPVSTTHRAMELIVLVSYGRKYFYAEHK